MKVPKITILFIFLVWLPVTSYKAQSLGWSFDNILATIKVSPKYSYYKVEQGDTKYWIKAYSSDDTKMYTIFYFLKKDNRCGFITTTIQLEIVNDMIKSFNSKFVKLEELKWKDYENGIYHMIKVDDKMGYIHTYLFD